MSLHLTNSNSFRNCHIINTVYIVQILVYIYTFATLTAHGAEIGVGAIAANRLISRFDDLERLLTRHLRRIQRYRYRLLCDYFIAE